MLPARLGIRGPRKVARGELQVGTTYEAFGALQSDGELKIVASRYAPQYFRSDIHWRNAEQAFAIVEKGTWHEVVFDVVTMTESASGTGQDGDVVWVPEYECEIERLVPVPGVLDKDLAVR